MKMSEIKAAIEKYRTNFSYPGRDDSILCMIEALTAECKSLRRKVDELEARTHTQEIHHRRYA